jgi:SAM-dependent methyltransferase
MGKQQLLFKDDKYFEAASDDWNFKDADTQYLTHGIHPYPARMIPQIAGKLMDTYISNLKKPIVADIFCGSGTVNVEACLRGYYNFGIDLNPFAILISEVKTTRIENPKLITDTRIRLVNELKKYKKPFEEEIPKFKNLQHWFKNYVIDKLSYIKHLIRLIEDSEVQKIAYIAFANTIMKSSNVNWKSSRYIRVFSKDYIVNFNPNVFRIFEDSFYEIELRIKEFIKKRKNIATIIKADARNLPLDNELVDIIITSPPYGEERNTIPYIRWSKLFLLWMGLTEEEIIDSEKASLGGNRISSASTEDIPSETFWKTIKGISEIRIKETLPFMIDYLTTIKEMKRILKPNRYCCIVIGNRSINKKLLDMGKVTIEFSLFHGFNLERAYQRRIPKKMIPWTTPTGDTIFNENIIILRN